MVESGCTRGGAGNVAESVYVSHLSDSKPGVRPGSDSGDGTGLQSHRQRGLSRSDGLSGVARSARVDLTSLFASFPDSSAAPERHDEDVAMAGPRGVGRRDRGDTVRDPVVVNERGIAGVRQRERAELGPVQPEDGRRAAHDVLAADQQHQHEIDTIAMGAFRRRMPAASARASMRN